MEKKLTELLLNSRKVCYKLTLTLSWRDFLIPVEEFQTHQSYWREVGKGIFFNLGCLKELDMDIWLSVFLRISPCQGKPPG